MKFQKVLIPIYLLVHGFLLYCVHRISGITPLYIVFTALTIITYLIVCIKDPGYLIVDEINIEMEQKQKPQISGILDNEDMPSARKQIDGLAAYGIPNANFPQNKKVEENNPQNLNHLGFSNKRVIIRKDKLYCGICMINQPYRTKHCHQCQKCVATYDHHCPWIANCVGQKNRQYFFIFLVMQTSQVFLSSVMVCYQAVNKIIPNKSQWILGVSLILFLSIILSLMIFHAYLMTVNMTTWQLARWNRISYFHKFQRSNGSPFSKGLGRNIAQYWIWGFRKSRKIWEFQH